MEEIGVYLLLPFVCPSQGISRTLKIPRKLLPAALSCSELQSGVFAGDMGKWEHSLHSPAQSIWKTSPLVGTRSLLHPGQGQQETASAPAICAEGQTSPVCGQEPLARAYSRDNYGSLESSCKHGEGGNIVFLKIGVGRAGGGPRPGWGGWGAVFLLTSLQGTKGTGRKNGGPGPLMNSSCRSTPGPGLSLPH